MRRPCPLLVVLFLLYPGFLIAQASDSLNVPQTFEERYDAYVTNLSPEKVYLHLDKDVYAIGDTIWFKGYVLNASALSSDPESRFIYVELTRMIVSKNLISGRYEEIPYMEKRVKIKQVGGVFQGYLPISDESNSGYAKIRAFTYWNLNKEPEYLFNKTISIINPVKDDYIKGLEKKKIRDDSFYEDIGSENPFHKIRRVETLDCQFFPESGRMLAGRPNRIGIKVIDNEGLGRQAEGIIYNQNNEEVTSFSTDEYGFGSVLLKPQSSGRIYRAVVEDLRGVKKKIDLPEVESEGVVISLLPKERMIEARMFVCGGINADSLRFLLADRNEIYYNEPLSRVMRVNLPVSGMASGINNAVVCDRNGNILAKRSFFVMPDTTVKADAMPSYYLSGSSKDSLTRRSPVRCSFKIGTKEGGNFSASVSDNLLSPCSNLGDNIISHFLLSSEIRGNIENPQRFFTDSIPLEKRMSDIDLLMLTQGWEYYDLPAILSGQYPMPKYGREYIQSIAGQVKRGFLRKKKATIVGFIAPKINFAAMGQIDKEGYFELKDINFPDSTTFLVSASNIAGNRHYRPEIYEDAFAPLTKMTFNKEKFTYSPKVAEIVTNNYYDAGGDLSYQLNPITVYGNKRSLPGISPLPLYEFRSDQIRQGRRLTPYKSYDVVSYLAESCPGLRLRQTQTARQVVCRTHSAVLNLFNMENQESLTWRPIIVYINGIREPSWEFIETIMMDEVEAVVYLRGIEAMPFAMGAQFGFGTSEDVAVVLLKVKDIVRSLWHVSQGKPLGWQKPKKYYIPQYATKGKDIIRKGADRRSSLYWNPSLKADKDGTIDFTFYTSDLLNGYTVTLEGVTFDGKLVSNKLIIE